VELLHFLVAASTRVAGRMETNMDMEEIYISQWTDMGR